jgi:FixJ family two-component response regulator
MMRGAMAVMGANMRPEVMGQHLLRAIQVDFHRRQGLLRKEEFRRRLEQLNEKERAVLHGVLEGLPNKQIARKSQVSQRTVESRRHDIYAKTKTTGLVELMRVVLEAGWDTESQGTCPSM